MLKASVGSRLDLGDLASFAKLDQHLNRVQEHDTAARADQQAAATRMWTRHVGDNGVDVDEILEDLLRQPCFFNPSCLISKTLAEMLNSWTARSMQK